jgi:hypothetical protein
MVSMFRLCIALMIASLFSPLNAAPSVTWSLNQAYYQSGGYADYNRQIHKKQWSFALGLVSAGTLLGGAYYSYSAYQHRQEQKAIQHSYDLATTGADFAAFKTNFDKEGQAFDKDLTSAQWLYGTSLLTGTALGVVLWTF